MRCPDCGGHGCRSQYIGGLGYRTRTCTKCKGTGVLDETETVNPQGDDR